MVTKIDTFLDPLLDYHLTRIGRASGAHAQSLIPAQRLRQYLTIKVDIGRQLGQSQYIARTAQHGDLILCENKHTYETMIQRVSVINGLLDIGPQVVRIVAKLRLEGLFSDVWIDDASHVTPEFLEELYVELAGKCRRFILIG